MQPPLIGSAGMLPRNLDEAGILADLCIHNFQGQIHWNQEWQELYAAALRRKEGDLTAHGVLKTVTGDRTGRSPNDRYIVDLGGSEYSRTKDVWWGDVNVPISHEKYDVLRQDVVSYLSLIHI